MSSVYSNHNLEGRSFPKQDLSKTDFSGSNIKSTDFSNSDLSYSNFSNVQAGLRKKYVVLLFIGALIVSLFSGYISMLTGATIELMLDSPDKNVHYSGIASIVIIVIFIVWSFVKGVGHAFRWFISICILFAALTGIFSIVSGFGTGMGALYTILSLILISFMFLVGTISRATAGTLSSNILFLIVALGGGTFGSNIGGGISAVVMALACAQISKKALKGKPGFEHLRKIALTVGTKFGTSFKNANLSYANFSNATLKNVNLKNAITTGAKWDNAKKINCLE